MSIMNKNVECSVSEALQVTGLKGQVWVKYNI